MTNTRRHWSASPNTVLALGVLVLLEILWLTSMPSRGTLRVPILYVYRSAGSMHVTDTENGLQQVVGTIRAYQVIAASPARLATRRKLDPTINFTSNSNGAMLNQTERSQLRSAYAEWLYQQFHDSSLTAVVLQNLPARDELLFSGCALILAICVPPLAFLYSLVICLYYTILTRRTAAAVARGHCPHCGYECGFVSKGRCPECGNDVDLTRLLPGYK
jgi:hypothetical protein